MAFSRHRLARFWRVEYFLLSRGEGSRQARAACAGSASRQDLKKKSDKLCHRKTPLTAVMHQFPSLRGDHVRPLGQGVAGMPTVVSRLVSLSSSSSPRVADPPPSISAANLQPIIARGLSTRKTGAWSKPWTEI